MIDDNQRKDLICSAYAAWELDPDNQYTKDIISLVVGDIIVETLQEYGFN